MDSLMSRIVLLGAVPVMILLFTTASSLADDDAACLLSFKKCVTGDPSGLLASWQPSSHPCRWRGVACHRLTRRVISIHIPGGHLSGTLSPSLANLTRLRSLRLPSHNLSGPIPPRLIATAALRLLDLSGNRLSGAIPLAPGPCRRLTRLDLSNNLLGGIGIGIPAGIAKCRRLHTLLLAGNVLVGSIPAQLGLLQRLRLLDVSRNSLTGRIPARLSNCTALAALVLSADVSDGEFNAFHGGLPPALAPRLRVLWAPRANLGGRLEANWSGGCALRVLNLGQNYIAGAVPEGMIRSCTGLTFLDLSSNYLGGLLPRLPRVGHLNLSRNLFNGALPLVPIPTHKHVVHDLSWNRFAGPLPTFSAAAVSYTLLLNNNRFNTSLPPMLPHCNTLRSFSLDLTANRLSTLPLHCLPLTSLEAAYNRITGRGSLAGVGCLRKLRRLDLRGNMLSATLPPELGNLKSLEWLLLRANNLTGQIPPQLGRLPSLLLLDLSLNALTGPIPAALANASTLRTLLLQHNALTGQIPASFSRLVALTKLDISFNNLSGHIPRLPRIGNCEPFKGNRYLSPCPDPYSSAPPVGLPHRRKELGTAHMIAAVTCTAVGALCSLLVLILIFGRKGVGRVRSKVVVTFADSPADLNYNDVVRATRNFSIQNLIGTGGFGSTYKAELAPGLLVAVKRLAIGRFQSGVRQFDAEIRTLGRVRHENLVTLVGYYVGANEMLLIYNYLSGGNLDTFIHKPSQRAVEWAVIHKIAVDVARALAYLHYSCAPRIVHRDIKPSNILLDQHLNAYLSDFGLARLLQASETHATTGVAGTFGYVAPEYATTCRVSDKSDVYSFGVVLLELMSGKRSVDPWFSDYGDGFNIVEWAKMVIREGRCSELFSPGMWGTAAEQERDNLLEMLSLASACTLESLSARPSMKQVLDKLKQLFLP